ncbi:MAG: 50S ribosomal protein L4 [Halobacteriovoraceae bacterium]|nr:50S ribosomal protein L4 [Halobacteriovoraceae bacterium]
MSSIKILDKTFGKEVGETELGLDKETYSVSAVHQVVKATLAGRRQGNHSTKTRGLVSGGGAKPFKQKGTGRARQGSTRSPLMPGGGTAFGPQPRSYVQKVNKKMMLSAISTVLLDKYNNGKLILVDEFDKFSKTKDLNTLLESKNLNNSYLLADEGSTNLLRFARNLPRVQASEVKGFSVYNSLKYENLVMSVAAFQKLKERLG